MSTTKYSLKVETKDVVFDVRVKDNATKDLIVFEGSNKHKQWSSKLCVIKTDEVFAISCDSSGLLLTGFIDGKEVYSIFCNDDGEITYKLRDESHLMRMSSSNVKVEQKTESTTIGNDRRLTLLTIIKLIAKGATVETTKALLKEAGCTLNVPDEFLIRLSNLYQTVILKQKVSIALTLDDATIIIVKHYDPENYSKHMNSHLLEWDDFMLQEKERLVTESFSAASTTVSSDFYYDGIKEMVRKFHRFYKFKGSHYNTEHNRNKIIRDTSYLSIPTDVVAAIFKGFCDFILAYNQDMSFRQQLEEISDEQINNVIAIVREKHINYIQTSEWRQWIIENPISKI